MSGYFDDEPNGDDLPDPCVPELTVDISDPPVVTATLYDAAGEPWLLLVDRRQVPFGFQVPA